MKGRDCVDHCGVYHAAERFIGQLRKLCCVERSVDLPLYFSEILARKLRMNEKGMQRCRWISSGVAASRSKEAVRGAIGAAAAAKDGIQVVGNEDRPWIRHAEVEIVIVTITV